MRAVVSRIVIQSEESVTTIQFVDANGETIRDTMQDRAIVVSHNNSNVNMSMIEKIMIGTFSRLGAEIKLAHEKGKKVVFDLQWSSGSPDSDDAMNIQIKHLGEYGSIRNNAVKVLIKNGIEKISDLREKTVDDLLSLQGFGNASLHDLLSTLTDLGLRSSDSRFRIQRKVIDL